MLRASRRRTACLGLKCTIRTQVRITIERYTSNSIESFLVMKVSRLVSEVLNLLIERVAQFLLCVPESYHSP